MLVHREFVWGCLCMFRGMGGLWLWLAHLNQMVVGLCDFVMLIDR